MRSMIAKVLAAHYVILPLYLYDHSGITMNTEGFSCRWDSGQVGWIVCDLKTATENFPGTTGWDSPVEWHDEETITLKEATERNLKSEVKTYDQYISGEVYGFIVQEWEGCECCGRGDWNDVDSCWAFFGSDPEQNGMDYYLNDADLELAKEAANKF